MNIDNDFNQIENKIEYTFRNKNLLKQVFTSKAYAQRNKDCCSYETLLSHGSLALALIDEMTYSKRCVNAEGFCNEECLPIIDIENNAESQRWRYYDFLYMYDLFDCLLQLDDERKICYEENNSFVHNIPKALIGAIALDSNWNITEIVKVYDKINYLDNFEDNYILQLDNWCLRADITSPKYTEPKINGISSPLKDEYTCSVVIKNKEFFGNGNSIFNARMKAAEKAYNRFYKEVLMSICGKPNRETAVDQLYKLYDEEYIPEPRYLTEDYYFEDDTCGFEVTCSVIDDDMYEIQNVYSKESDFGMREVAYKMLCNILEYPYDEIEE